MLLWGVLITTFFLGCQKKSDTPGLDLGNSETIKEMVSHPDLRLEEDGAFQIGSVIGILPEGWTFTEPVLDKYFAQVELPAVQEDSESGQLAIFRLEEDTTYTQGEIHRWYGQFVQRGGRPTVEVARWEDFENNALHIRMVHFTGTFRQSRQRGDPETSKKRDWMNLSAVVRCPEGDWFFKGTGPRRTMKSYMEDMRQFLLDLDYKL